MAKSKYEVRIEAVSATETFPNMLEALAFIDEYVDECGTDNPGLITIQKS